MPDNLKVMKAKRCNGFKKAEELLKGTADPSNGGGNNTPANIDANNGTPAPTADSSTPASNAGSAVNDNEVVVAIGMKMTDLNDIGVSLAREIKLQLMGRSNTDIEIILSELIVKLGNQRDALAM